MADTSPSAVPQGELAAVPQLEQGATLAAAVQRLGRQTTALGDMEGWPGTNGAPDRVRASARSVARGVGKEELLAADLVGRDGGLAR
jgi:hypothetical protein